MSWGTTLTGMSDAVDVLQSVKMQWDSETLYVAGPTVEYAVWHEVGTTDMEARPFMRPAADRVQADPERYAKQIATSQGIDITNEEGYVRALALAVQTQAQRIADKKDVRDNGDLIASITVEQVS